MEFLFDVRQFYSYEHCRARMVYNGHWRPGKLVSIFVHLLVENYCPSTGVAREEICDASIISLIELQAHNFFDVNSFPCMVMQEK